MGTTPIFICTGFLDSGKTTLIKDEEYGNAAGRRGRAAESYIFQKLFEELPADTGCD